MKRLREYTMARVGLGRAGTSLATRDVLEFQLAHAQARDAVYFAFDPVSLSRGCQQHGWASCILRSAARDRDTYLRRPDLGRRLAEGSALPPGPVELALVVADGLSSRAVHAHAIPLLQALLPLLSGWTYSPVCLVEQGRVAVGDEIADRLRAELTLVLIGERPGLSSPDSLGAYLTWSARPGRTDAERNCISNIRIGGLGYKEAAVRLFALMEGARRLQMTGVALKERDSRQVSGQREDRALL